ncbi:MAG: hypothetical protein ACJAZO_000128 [Myxococcota bacterium]
MFRLTKPAPTGTRARKAYNKEKRRLQEDKSRWVRSRQDELLSGKVDDVLREIRALHQRVGRTGPGTRSRRKAFSDATTYLENHRKYLTYSEIGDIVMGTGIVEGTIKQLGARLKGPGMRWSVERAERVLALRCLQLSNAWAPFEAGVLAGHEALTSLHIPAITPTEQVTTYKAARKAA